jgi:hypothetical protein
MRSVNRVGVVLFAAVALAGCQTKGENLPLEVAMYRVITPDVPERVQVIPPAPAPLPEEVVRVGSGLWQVGFRQYQLPRRAVQPVGSAAGLTFYALSWDNMPFDRLLVEQPGRPGEFREFLGVY